MNITRYIAADVQTSATGELVSYEDWLYERGALLSARQAYNRAQQELEELRKAYRSLQQDVEELEERLRSK